MATVFSLFGISFWQSQPFLFIPRSYFLWLLWITGQTVAAQWRIISFFFLLLKSDVNWLYWCRLCQWEGAFGLLFLEGRNKSVRFSFSVSWSNNFSLTLNQCKCQRGEMSLLLFVMMRGGQLSILQSYFFTIYFWVCVFVLVISDDHWTLKCWGTHYSTLRNLWSHKICQHWVLSICNYIEMLRFKLHTDNYLGSALSKNSNTIPSVYQDDIWGKKSYR